MAGVYAVSTYKAFLLLYLSVNFSRATGKGSCFSLSILSAVSVSRLGAIVTTVCADKFVDFDSIEVNGKNPSRFTRRVVAVLHSMALNITPFETCSKYVIRRCDHYAGITRQTVWRMYNPCLGLHETVVRRDTY